MKKKECVLTWEMGILGLEETGKRGHPRTLSRILRSDFLVIKIKEKWVLSQFLHEEEEEEEEWVSSSFVGTSDNGARRIISSSSSVEPTTLWYFYITIHTYKHFGFVENICCFKYKYKYYTTFSLSLSSFFSSRAPNLASYLLAHISICHI